MTEVGKFELILKSVTVRELIPPGWHRRDKAGGLTYIDGWRLVLHRLLWGFGRLKHIGNDEAWVAFEWPGFGASA